MAFKIDLKNPRVRNILIIAAVGVAGTLLWYQTVYVERQRTVDTLHREFERKQNELNSILALKPQLKKLEKDIAAAQVRLDSLKSMFPDQKEIPKLIREITSVARASEIYTTKFSPLPDIQREYYVENRYDMSVSGGYHQLAEFYGFLANLPLIINLSNVSIKANGNLAQSKKEAEEHGGPVSSIAASFQMTTFSSNK
jgi:type IV pilus assembly protein PilO